MAPTLSYDTKNYCHHFDSNDHRELGTDLVKVFYEYLIKSKEDSHKQEELETLRSRYQIFLHGRLTSRGRTAGG